MTAVKEEVRSGGKEEVAGPHALERTLPEEAGDVGDWGEMCSFRVRG